MATRADIIEVERSPADLSPLGGPPMLPAPPGAGGDQPVNILKIAHNLLRGRYLVTIVLALIFAAAGAAAGWAYRTPMYNCTGYIRIRPTLPAGLGMTPEKSMPADYYDFIQLQAKRLRTQDVIATALDHDSWRALGRGSDTGWQRLFRRRLLVAQDSRVQQLIAVVVMDPSAEAARIGVRRMIEAYIDRFGNDGAIDDGATLRLLKGQHDEAEKKLADLQRQITDVSKDYYGGNDLTALGKAYMDRIVQVENEISKIEMELARAAAIAARPKLPDGQQPTQRTAEEIAALDDKMNALLTAKRNAEFEIRRLEEQGAGEQHPDVVIRRSEVAQIATRITNYAKIWNEQIARGGDAKALAAPPKTVDDLKIELAGFEKMLEEYRREAMELGNRALVMESLRQRVKLVQDELNGITQRLSLIQAESRENLTARITIESLGDEPELKDSRKKWAAVGTVGGFGFPVALMMLLGFIDRRRLRYSDEAPVPNVALLGILPNLPRNLADPEQAAAAAHCVHRIRSLLQISGPAKKVYAVTSSVSGDGKTSLTLSLGLSYAASGSRTLLIDFDMIGGGLTSSLNAKTDSGLADVLVSGELNGHIVNTRTEGLSLLPIGRHDDRFASRLSAPVVRRLIDAVRDEYDIILVDTGPILGSLEAAFVSASADGVILVVGRGQQRSHVERAIEQLRAVGGHLVGLVFNRATAFDFRKSVASTSIRSVGVYPIPGENGRSGGTGNGGLKRLGPIAQTVVLDVRSDEPKDGGEGGGGTGGGGGGGGANGAPSKKES